MKKACLRLAWNGLLAVDRFRLRLARRKRLRRVFEPLLAWLERRMFSLFGLN